MIRAEALTKRYGAVTAVEDLTFEVKAGETFALIGPNGAGKTTTLKLLLGLAQPDTGRIAVGPGGLQPHDPRARHELGYVPQRVEFPGGRTVTEVLAFFADLRGLPRTAVERAIGRVGLTQLADRRASELSGGYTQRLSLGQALLGDPALLILDEPTASLDPESTWEFRSLLEQLRREGKTILLCSHLLSEVERVSDRVLILVNGRRAGLETLSDLRSRQMSASRLMVELAESSGRARSALERHGFSFETTGERALVLDGTDGRGLKALEVLREEGIEVRSFELQRPTLEEIFLSVVRGDRRES